ncbi:chromosome segregation protein [Bacillus cereus]|uniref:nuclease-related domain-containing protein n=1 Tax=Bacillus cereus TaxID=1396 RepID=UPI000BFD235C|nr:nuclease-related domain-containing protein [Bacillus cereus]PGR32146.1 chromosome segregation protein [Bacillus cereus]
MNYVLACLFFASLAVVFVLYFKLKQLSLEKGKLELEKKQVGENYLEEIAATVANYEQQKEKIKEEIQNEEREKYNELKISVDTEIEKYVNQLHAQYNIEKKEIQEKHYNEIKILNKLYTDLKVSTRNRGEVKTQEILCDIKKDFVQKGLVLDNEMHIIPNIFIPNTHNHYGNKNGNSQIDHLVLLTTGIYVIETKYWKGKIIHGLSKENSGIYSFMIDEIGKYQKRKVKEETFVFLMESSSEEETPIIKVKNYGNPAHQAKSAAISFYYYFKEGIKKDLKGLVNPIVYFGYETNENMNEVIDISKEDLPRLTNKDQLIEHFKNELENKTKLYTSSDLNEIKKEIEKINYLHG